MHNFKLYYHNVRGEQTRSRCYRYCNSSLQRNCIKQWALHTHLDNRRLTYHYHFQYTIKTRRPASADRTARRQFQATGQPVSRTQASDAMTSRPPRLRRTVCNAVASNGGRFLCVQVSRERSYPCQYIDTTRKEIDCATTLLLTVFI